MFTPHLCLLLFISFFSLIAADDACSVPDTTQDYTLIDITDDGFVTLMAGNSDTREDIHLPEGALGEDIRAAFEKGSGQILVTVATASCEESILSFKETN